MSGRACARTLAACALPAFAIALSWLRVESPARVGRGARLVVALALAPALVRRELGACARRRGSGRRRRRGSRSAAQAVGAAAVSRRARARPARRRSGRRDSGTSTASSCRSTRAGARRCTGSCSSRSSASCSPSRCSSPRERPVAAAAVDGRRRRLARDARRRWRGRARRARSRSGPLDPARPARALGPSLWRRERRRRPSSSSAPRGRPRRRRSRARPLSTGRAGTSTARRPRPPASASRGTRTTRASASRRRRPSCSRVKGPERAQYWRTSTLDLFTDDHWFEDPARGSRGSRTRSCGCRSTGSRRRRARNPKNLARAARSR